MKTFNIFFIAIITMTCLQAQDHIIGTDVVFNATFNHISIHVNIAGDQNLDAQMLIEYKKATEQDFKRTARVMRAHPTMIVDGQALGRNHFAGSALFLEPNTTYDIKITLDDPDDDAIDIIEDQITTKAFPVPAENGTVKHVVPGNGGGLGTINNPYLGLQDAATNASAGDIIMVKPGTYQAFEIRNNGTAEMPISFISEERHQAIIDGAGTDRGIITVGDFDLSPIGHIIDGFVIQNGNWAIDAQNTSFLTVQNNIIQDVSYGFINRRENNLESDQYIFNNVFIGRTEWPQLNGQIAPERAVDIRGNNHVVSFNTITDFGDGISTDGPPYESSYSLDIHNNEISNIVDDFIEIDGTVSNSRVYNNRGYNGRMGVSIAPIFGGPVYVFRNAFYNMELSTFKMNRKPAGLVIVHNLGIKKENGTSSDAGYQNTFIKNNIIMGTRYCFEEYGQIDPLTEDWDYNAYYSTRAGTTGDEWFKWQNVRYANIQTLAANTTIEQHGIAISPSDLNTVFIPQVYGISYSPDDQDHTIAAGSALVDNGDTLDNINDPYVTDGSPDIGPYELGQQLPQYGANFDNISAVAAAHLLNGVVVYPNPTNGIVQLQNLPTKVLLRIFDAYGRIIKTDQPNHLPIDLSLLNAGVYWIEITDAIHHLQVVKRVVFIK